MSAVLQPLRKRSAVAAVVAEPAMSDLFSCRLSEDRQWLIETFGEEQHRLRVERILFEGRSAYQDILILDTVEHDRVLVMDGETQSAEDDEYVYHEALVHPAMLAHPDPKRVLIIGGGEGATLREALRHRTVAKAVMVDIDGKIVELAKEFLGSWHQGAFDDPRAKVMICDGLEYLANTRDRFDVAIVDVCDYIEGTAVEGIYNATFFRSLANVMAEGGIVGVQAGELSPCEFSGTARLGGLLASNLGCAVTYSAFVESFWSEWSFMLAGEVPRDYGAYPPSVIDQAIDRRGLAKKLRFYDGLAHRRMFSLPKDIRSALVTSG